MEIRKQKWLEVADRYIKEECKEDGTQKLDTQMSKDQIAGKTKLEKRVSKGEIHISTSDKGKGVVVMPLSMYEKVTLRHTEKDKVVTWDHLKETQKIITSHARALDVKSRSNRKLI